MFETDDFILYSTIIISSISFITFYYFSRRLFKKSEIEVIQQEEEVVEEEPVDVQEVEEISDDEPEVVEEVVEVSEEEEFSEEDEETVPQPKSGLLADIIIEKTFKHLEEMKKTLPPPDLNSPFIDMDSAIAHYEFSEEELAVIRSVIQMQLTDKSAEKM